MSHLKSKLATISMVAMGAPLAPLAAATVTALGTAACSHNPSSHANSATAVKPAATYSAYGPAMGEAAGYVTGPSTEATPGSVGKQPPPAPGPAEMGGYTPPVEANGIVGTTPRGDLAPSPVSNAAPVTWGSGSADENHAEAVGVTNPMGGLPDVSSLSDAQLAAIVQAVNQGEIDEAQLALGRSTSPEVKRFARDMLGAHRDMQYKTNVLLGRLQLTPSENAVSNQLKSDTQSEMQELQTMRGKDFDRDYIDAQVRNHNKALEILERITPGVRNPDLKVAFTNDRPKVEAHLRAAERAQLALQRGTNPQP
jgi:putative membrane protein